MDAEASGSSPVGVPIERVGQRTVAKTATEASGKPQRHHRVAEFETNPTEQAVKPVWELALAVEHPAQPSALPLNALLDTLHAVYEAYKLDQVCWPYLIPMARLLKAIAAAAGATPFWEYYQRDVPEQALDSVLGRGSVPVTKERSRATDAVCRASPPSIFRWLQHRLRLPLLLPPGIAPETATCSAMSAHASQSNQQRQHDHPLVGSAHGLAEDGCSKDASNPLTRMAGLIRLFEASRAVAPRTTKPGTNPRSPSIIQRSP
ncbi:Anaphase-promoting complex subunit 1 [Cyanidiococcus yangmingshanensis]|uniref:Anaphase-promoting complex subunit 1 n=1 Tax=Cyanidiococcus yangmingshanensis TaxID=2690220 RepID=A0A7J7INC2_9RHOD|nr:Anaphase-promoting complex subunit 1 [Cyanidiococcus yangmingshanensis]